MKFKGAAVWSRRFVNEDIAINNQTNDWDRSFNACEGNHLFFLGCGQRLDESNFSVYVGIKVSLFHVLCIKKRRLKEKI